MSTPLNQEFQEFIKNRCENGADQLHTNPEYKKCADEADELFHKLHAMLPPEGQVLLREYETKEGYLGALGEERVYKIGLQDGIELRRELGLLS